MRRNKRNTGQATIEFLYVIPILLLLLLGSLQFIFIYEARQTLNYAAFTGTRMGALNGGDMAAIKEGVVSGLTPLYVHDETQAALKTSYRMIRGEIEDDRLARIEILNPTTDMYSEFANADGVIPNDNLMYRSTSAGSSGANVQDANLLKVRVTYCVRLVVPIVNRMIHAFTVTQPSTPEEIDSTYAGGKIAASNILKAPLTPGSSTALCSAPDNTYPYRMPVSAEAIVRMQTPFANASTWVYP